MKILMISGMANAGGTERATLNLCTALATKDANLYLLSDCGPYVNSIKELGVKHLEHDIHFKKNIWGTIKTFIKLPFILRKYDIDIIHSQMAFPTLLALCGVIFSGRYSKTKILWHSRGLHKETYKKVCFLFSKFNIYALGNAQQEMNKLIHFGMPKQYINYIYNNFSNNFFKQIDNNITREAFSIDKDTLVIGSISRLEEDRAVDIFLELCAKAYKKNKNITFIVCGDGSYKKSLQELAKKLGIDKNTLFLGEVKSMVSVYSMLDILINPINLKKGEGAGIGNNIIEAFFTKVLVLSSNVAAISEIVHEGKTGFLLDVNNIEETSQKINSVIANFKIHQKITDTAYSFAKSQFDTEVFSKKMNTIYQHIHEGRSIDEIK
jgi:glycosyltransferase involved in cell wall biosynthesis